MRRAAGRAHVLAPCLPLSLQNWLYEDGEDAAKSVYLAKLEELQAQGRPVERRAEEDAARPAAAAGLRATAERLLAEARSDDPKYAHIAAGERQKVAAACEAALAFLVEKDAAQVLLQKHEDPAVTAGDLVARDMALRREAELVLSRPPPPPKPAAEASAVQEGNTAAGDEATPEQMDTEAAETSPQLAEGPQQMEEEAAV